jgi:hypothetical protein
MRFDDSRTAEDYFADMLRLRGLTDIRKETIVEYVKGGRRAYPKLYHCGNSEAYLVTFWRNKDARIKDSSQVSDAGKELDERLKFAIHTFGENLYQMTQCKEQTLLRLLDLLEKGVETFLVTIYGDGDIFWCKARDFYEFATRYGTYQQFSATSDMAMSLPYRVPTGWMKPWAQRNPVVGYPQLADEGGD